ncbi:vasorin-like isoform X3 [Mytilus trossulus]|uniref:vasorin-like isoform X3 n=1 Tax=Mytilus trossulus TaxID=6551 RepID=UPI003005BD63
MEKIYNTIFIIACTIYGCTVNGCPSLCRCTSTNVVYCSGKSLTTVPSNIPNSTTLLYISQNKITLKDDYAFAGLSALKIMYINDNKITRINEHSFDGLSALTHLYIHGNNITIIDGHSFDGLSALTHLYLEENTLDCSKCELKKFKAFLLTTKRVFVGGASCDGRPLIYHNFNNCKETITTEAFPSSAGKDNPESTTESITGNQASTTKSTTVSCIVLVVLLQIFDFMIASSVSIS